RLAQKPVCDFPQAFQDAGAEGDVAKPSSTRDSFGDRPSDVKPPRPASDDTMKGESKRRAEPGSFTEQFMGALGEGAQLPQPPAPNEFPKYAKDVQFSTARPQVVPAPDFWGEANSPEVPAELPKEAS